jgi:prepilin-type processing-associated H-X9-DG protein
MGVTIDSGPVAQRLTRHGGGGNFLMCDGHVKWFRITASPGTGRIPSPPRRTTNVYFPPYQDYQQTAPAGIAVWTHSETSSPPEPDPGGDMRGYAATFHLN